MENNLERRIEKENKMSNGETKIAEFLSKMFHPVLEVTVNDYSNPNHAVIAIFN